MGQRQAMQAWRVLLVAAALLFQPLLAARSSTGIRMHDLRATIPKPGSAKLMPGAVGVSAVRMDDGSFKIAALGHEDALAEAVFVDGDLTVSNMGHLEVWTWPRASDQQQLNAAGYIEGWATAERIAQHFYNMWTVENVTDPEVMRWFRTQHDWVRGQLEDPATQDAPYWHAMRLTMQQFDGMVKGYNDRALTLNADPGRVAAGVAPLPALSVDQFYFLCSLGDLSDVEDAIAHRRQQEQAAGGVEAGTGAAIGVVGRTDWSRMSPQEVQMELAVSDRCSALVKVSPDFREIWVSQAAWYTYASMLRVFKHYDFAISDPSILGRSMGFSSYYGQLTSEDDFYLVGSGLAVLQTTNRIFDMALLDRIRPEGVLLCWQRVRVACAVAPDGPSWARAIQAYNSGTYTNSWMVVDLGAFEPGKALPQWMLTVVEQVPGNVWWEDRTQQLESGYMALFNVPVLPQTYAALGYPQFVQQMVSRGHKYGEAVSGALWQVAPRAKQFRRDHAAVTDMDSMQQLMRSNNWQTDPYSMNVSTNAICGRADVDPDTPAARGCYDGKVSNLRMALALEAQVINGPPHNQHMQPFTWAGSPWEQLVPHVGQPSRFEFEWEIMRPSHTAASRQAASVQPA